MNVFLMLRIKKREPPTGGDGGTKEKRKTKTSLIPK
jgi:hypothetical protein